MANGKRQGKKARAKRNGHSDQDKEAKSRKRVNKAEARYKAYRTAVPSPVCEPPVHEDRDLVGRATRIDLDPDPGLDAPDDEVEEVVGTRRGGRGTLFGELADGEELPVRGRSDSQRWRSE